MLVLKPKLTMMCVSMVSLTAGLVWAGKHAEIPLQISEKEYELPKEARAQSPLITEDNSNFILKYPSIKTDKKTKVSQGSYTVFTLNANLEQVGSPSTEKMSDNEIAKWKPASGEGVREGTKSFVRDGKLIFGRSFSGLKELSNGSLYVYKYKYQVPEKGGCLYWNPAKSEYGKDFPEPSVVKGESIDNFNGLCDYRNNETGDFVVLGFKDNDDQREFSLMYIDTALNAHSVKLPLDAKEKYALVYADLIKKQSDAVMNDISTADMLFIFAPGGKSKDLKNFRCLRVDKTGAVVADFTFTSPSASLAIMAMNTIGEDIVLFAFSEETDKCFEETFNNNGQYGTIMGAAILGNEYFCPMAATYYKHLLDVEFNAVHLVKISNNKLAWISSTTVKDCKKITKSKPAYEGSNVCIADMIKDQSNGNFWVAAQMRNFGLTNKAVDLYEYKDMYIFHFDAQGKLVSTYGSEREFDGNADVGLESSQNLLFSKSGSNLFWFCNEAKQTSVTPSLGYIATGSGTVTRNFAYVPRVGAIDKAGETASEMKTLGDGNYSLYSNNGFIRKGDTVYLIGTDEDMKKLWVAKVSQK